MAHTTNLDPDIPMPTSAGFRLQMEGMAMAAVYVASFGMSHLAGASPLVSANALALFLGGLIVLPLAAALPLVLVRHLIVDRLHRSQPSIAAFLPFARLALYALQGLLVWVATREAYAWVVAQGWMG